MWLLQGLQVRSPSGPPYSSTQVRITDKWEPVIGKMIRIYKAEIAVLIPSKHEAI